MCLDIFILQLSKQGKKKVKIESSHVEMETRSEVAEGVACVRGRGEGGLGSTASIRQS